MSKWIHNATGREVRELGGASIILADPAWQYDNDGRGSAENHYRTMPLEEICALPVGDLAAKDSLLFLWAVWPMLFEARDVMNAWGFDYKNCAFLWVKTTKDGNKDAVGMGHYTRGNTEPCLLAVRGRGIELVKSHAVRQVILEGQGEALIAPRSKHSAKPQEARDRIINLCGTEPAAVEMFARDRDPRFEVWGNEVHETITLRKAA